MQLIELIKSKTNNYKDVSNILETSEWGVEQIINGNGLVTLNNLEKLLNYFGLEIIEKENQTNKYEISTEVNTKTFRNYAAYWLSKKRYEIRESTLANYTNLFKNNILPCIGNVPLENFNNTLIQNFAYWCKEKGGSKGNGISEHNIRDSIALIKAVVQSGQEEGIIPEFIFKKVKIPKTLMIQHSKQIYSEKEYHQIIEYILKNISNRSVGILLGIYTGMRIGELCALKWEDIDFNENIININKTLQRIYNPLDELEKSKIIITPAKTQSSIRQIPIAHDVIEILKTLKTNNENYVLTGKNKWTEPRTFRKYYNKVMNQIGIEPIKFHSLRHTFASINIENGVDVKTISEILGHSDINTTLKIYTHTSNTGKARAINKFNEMFKTQEEKMKFTKNYKGNVCCINKKTLKLDFIGSVMEVSNYIAEPSAYVCAVINGIEDDKVYNIVPKIEGITFKNGEYVGG